MEEAFISIGSGLLIISVVAIFWVPFCWAMLTYGDAGNFNKRKH